jgi:hypothetical protein
MFMMVIAILYTLAIIFSILSPTDYLFYSLLPFKYHFFLSFLLYFCQHSMKEKILHFHTFFELHSTNVCTVQYSSIITQFMKAKQPRTKQLINFYLFIYFKKSNNTKSKAKQLETYNN